MAGAIGSLDAEPTHYQKTFDPTAEEAYWREHFYSRPYVRPGHLWSAFGPAFHLGWHARHRFALRSWADIEGDLERRWRERQGHQIPWRLAKLAARDAWDRLTTWFDDLEEEAYWRGRSPERSEGQAGDSNDYRAAFRFGWEAKRRHAGSSWPEAEALVETEWHELELDRRLPWQLARDAVRDAWRRVEATLPDPGNVA